MTDAERTLLLICGPTASGKTALSLGLADRFPLRLISADSMQVYRGMDIGTAKPEGADKPRFALLDVVNPGEGFSAGRFAALASAEAEAAWATGQIPCVVGGTGLYFQALIHGLADIPSIAPEIRETVSISPVEALVAELKAKDPETALRIELRNPRRVQRAVEVLRATGEGLASWQDKGSFGALNHSKRLMLGINPSPEALQQAVKKRNTQALAHGWLDEAKALASKFGEAAIRSIGAIGYTELLDVAAGKQSLWEASHLIETRTLQYARRQRTWFRREKEIVWYETADLEQIAQRIKNEI